MRKLNSSFPLPVTWIFSHAVRKRKISQRKRKEKKFQNEWSQYSNFMSNQWCEKNCSQKVSHPLFFVTEKEFRNLSANAIIVKNMQIDETKKNNRNVSYDIESYGSSLVITNLENGSICVNLKQTKNNCFYVMIRSSEIHKSKDSQTLELLSSNQPIAEWKFKNHKYILLLQCKDYSNISLSPEDFITEYDLTQV